MPIDPDEIGQSRVPLGRAGQTQDIANGVLFSRLRCVQLHDGGGAGDRRRHDRRHETSVELNWMAGEKALPSVGSECDFSGKFHTNISMEDSAKVALLASCIA